MDSTSKIWFILNFINDDRSSISSSINSNIAEIKDEKLNIYIDGYILPRISVYDAYKDLSQDNLVLTLFKKYKFDFIKYIKGVFVIVLKIDEDYYIFNDRHSLKKYFIYHSNNEFIISNSLKYISEQKSLTLSKENAAIYCLLEHFVDGMTMFNEVNCSKPATQLKISKSREIEISNYWEPSSLLNRKIEKYPFEDIAFKWLDIIKSYVDYLKPREITMTLTGGNDSRMVLAGLLANGIKPNAFTFGNPLSSDGIIANQVALNMGLNYNNYFVSKPTKEWFSEYSNKIINIGNTLINIHRAHRLDAIEKQMENNSSTEMIFGGFMGGDYTKGIIYDDYITTRLLRLWKYSSKSDIENIQEIMNAYFWDLNSIDLNSLLSRLKQLPYFNRDYSDLHREFYYLFYVVGSTHDWQDSNVFASKIKYVVNPFMDIDFLELLFSSKFSMLQKNNSEDGFITKLSYPELAVNITHILCPVLSDIPYAKKGFYTNNEYLGNKILYLLKRLIRYRIKKTYPQNFPYNNWMKDFVVEEISNLSLELSSIFSLEMLKENFNSSTYLPTEGYWHKFTNPINLSLNLKEFIK